MSLHWTRSLVGRSVTSNIYRQQQKQSLKPNPLTWSVTTNNPLSPFSECVSIRQQSRRYATTTPSAGNNKKKNPYSDTILLPNTGFALRADAAKREHLFRDRCTKDLYPWQLKNNPEELFILHDGPPYANGSVHSGHAMNKILKDIINRYHVLKGRKVWYRPGWDCHGLPIEMKALEQLRSKGTIAMLSPIQIRDLAKKKALKELDIQRNAFKSWGIMGDWDNPYRTLDKDYELRQLDVFNEMVKKGYIYRQLKPVYWSPSSKSALAESELEYNDAHKSRSIHVRFPMVNLAPSLQEKWKNHLNQLYAVIWTTTPWTIPSNKAVAVHPDLEYSLVRLTNGDDCYLIGSDRVDAFASELDQTVHVLDKVPGSTLIGSSYQHPLWKDDRLIIGGNHVTSDSGTGLVHTAPGHGMEDYEVCSKIGISPFIGDDGKFTKEVASLGLEGKMAFNEGTATVIDLLAKESALMLEKDYIHKYPYDWRTKQPVMLRATAQWFANVEQLQIKAVEALKNTRMIPEVSLRRLEQFTLSRKEWCISRQRSWGVPIPALYNSETGEALLTQESVQHIIDIFDKNGSTDIWWEAEDDDLFIAPKYKDDGNTYIRGYDTMDVWFDSGTSWTMIKEYTERDPKDETPLADVCLEGSDQHRGWFQSSLLTSIALTGKAPYGTLITHGFALDEQGRKMSKSIGNTVEPGLITDGGKDKKKNPAYGSDVLRMWVANCEYSRDVSIGPTIIAQMSEIMRKIRTTARFMLGNLHDFTYKDKIKYEDLKEIDKYMLHELYQFNLDVRAAFDDFAFNRAMQHVQNFTTNQLSAFYFDVIKDRVYNDRQDAITRRMAQTVLYEILNTYTLALSPVVCHTAEEIYEHYRSKTPTPESSIFKIDQWHPNQLQLYSEWNNPELNTKWILLKELKGQVNQVLEQARQEK
ncbi:tRNA synthetases class I-domain-containing protein [Halteromyces radiatus]|uniref:tRNA synthetases class I-domain-containing protein n=1 Tax=Halteromyces radiatus TaxID=101107 RepID=UPI00221F24BB|nr:tRNA synthetases class I-domain-containing protein [Halteromyces radiatus]KAI8092665.1 tRNA synthetases class I-domain-containing protein [Halteromyces radiatus]